MVDEDFEYERIGNHYDNMIWRVFSVGIALSVYILYLVWTDKLSLYVAPIALFLGFFALLYCICAIFSFNRKKRYMYDKARKVSDIFNSRGYLKIAYLEVFPLATIFITYLVSFILLFDQRFWLITVMALLFFSVILIRNHFKS